MIRLSSFVLTAIVIAATGTASAQTTEISRRTAAARAAQAAGDYAQAMQEYDAALKPGAQGSPEERAEAALNFAHFLDTFDPLPLLGVPSDGRMLGMWQGKSVDASISAALLPQMYALAVQSGTPTQRSFARNELGALLLRDKKNAEALGVLQQIDLNSDAARRFVYRYNLGRAFAANGRPADALSAFLGAVSARPSFAPAVDAALNVLVRADRFDVRSSANLATMLLSNREIAAAGRVTSSLLTRWAGDPAAGRLLALRLRWYVAASLEIPAFRRDEAPALDKLRPSTDVRALVQDVKRAFSDDTLPPGPVFDGPPGFSVQWMAPSQGEPGAMDDLRTSFAALLTAIGQRFEEREGYRQALSRYLAAWSLDRANGESAVKAAMLLQAHPDLDAGGRALDALIENIFSAKGNFIAESDWPNSQRLHIVLARIFEKLDKWGPVTNSHSALYQWTAAIEDDARIRSANRTFTPSPGLYEHLGDCYRRARQPNLPAAAEQYRRAAKEFELVGRPEDASRLRQLAETVGPPR